ncbi:MAG: hypothetical protein NT004_00340 [Bacteroidetes bacterium]|nr:hypothetical protein [Bacteroidota bacterium]
MTPYTRYVWAYNACGQSPATILSGTTTGIVVNAPVAGTHIPSMNQIVWKWNSVAGATGYKWSPSNDFSTAIDMGTSLLIAETGLTCNTAYTRFVWAYNECGSSIVTALTEATLSAFINSTTAGTNVASPTQIVWNWNSVIGATGYKWNMVDDYSTATDMGMAITKTETGLTCNMVYQRYVWAYKSCGYSTPVSLTQTTSACSSCGSSITINHSAGAIAPVSKTVIYGTVNNIPGEPSKCWITSNLGASRQAMVVDDTTEASAGWYWQFNRKQGYKHNGITRTPNTAWITPIIENLDWQSANDPCTLELGNGWRIPTSTEWTNVDASGGWINWNGPWTSGLKMHAAGYLFSSDGLLTNRGISGGYWSIAQFNDVYGWFIYFRSEISETLNGYKAAGLPLRCIKE